jgi:hypothetical protein
VVHVPIEDENLLHPELVRGQLGRDGDVVEQAEAHRPVGLGVVTCGTRDAESRVRLARDELADHRAHPSRRVERREIGALTDERVGVDLPTPAGAQCLDRRYVRLGVHKHQLCGAREWSLHALAAEPSSARHRGFDGSYRGRRVRMLGQQRARVVIERSGVVYEEHALDQY